MRSDPTREVRQAARRAARAAEAPLLLAVSGGLDSMAMLHAMAGVARSQIAAVATFDHGTGASATKAVDLVARAAGALGFPVVIGVAQPGVGTTASREADWRDARYTFLRETAAALGARIATAHTEDDQIETVLMRLMRGSGTRGLAALLAPSEIVRPWLALRRATLAAYAEHVGLRWIDDPTNYSTRFLRNRVRREVLPALRRADPSIDHTLGAIGRDAASWRRGMEAFVDANVRPVRAGPREIRVAASELAGYDRDSLAVLWGSLAGRAGLALDRRGTERLAAFTMEGRSRGCMPLSGGWRVDVKAGCFVLRKEAAGAAEPRSLPPRGELSWGSFRFRVVPDRGTPRSGDDGPWSAPLPLDGGWTVRPWQPGDRLAAAGSQPRRRVKRYLSDAGLRGLDRSGWPVVVGSGQDDVIWIPGVRRSDAATARSGRPARHYLCERIDR